MPVNNVKQMLVSCLESWFKMQLKLMFQMNAQIIELNKLLCIILENVYTTLCL